MAKDDPIKPDAAKAPLGGLKGLQANPGEMAQAIAFEINTGRAGDYAAKAIAKLSGERLSALIDEAKADKAASDLEVWSALDYLRSRYTAPVAIAYETRPVMA